LTPSTKYTNNSANAKSNTKKQLEIDLKLANKKLNFVIAQAKELCMLKLAETIARLAGTNSKVA